MVYTIGRGWRFFNQKNQNYKKFNTCNVLFPVLDVQGAWLQTFFVFWIYPSFTTFYISLAHYSGENLL